MWINKLDLLKPYNETQRLFYSLNLHGIKKFFKILNELVLKVEFILDSTSLFLKSPSFQTRSFLLILLQSISLALSISLFSPQLGQKCHPSSESNSSHSGSSTNRDSLVIICPGFCVGELIVCKTFSVSDFVGGKALDVVEFIGGEVLGTLELLFGEATQSVWA